MHIPSYENIKYLQWYTSEKKSKKSNLNGVSDIRDTHTEASYSDSEAIGFSKTQGKNFHQEESFTLLGEKSSFWNDVSGNNVS